jgi:hypothetical protein
MTNILDTVDAFFGARDGKLPWQERDEVRQLIHGTLFNYERMVLERCEVVKGNKECLKGLDCGYMLGYSFICGLLETPMKSDCGCCFAHPTYTPPPQPTPLEEALVDRLQGSQGTDSRTQMFIHWTPQELEMLNQVYGQGWHLRLIQQIDLVVRTNLRDNRPQMTSFYRDLKGKKVREGRPRMDDTIFFKEAKVVPIPNEPPLTKIDDVPEPAKTDDDGNPIQTVVQIPSLPTLEETYGKKD